jgi:hypothetical protein
LPAILIDLVSGNKIPYFPGISLKIEEQVTFGPKATTFLPGLLYQAETVS